jgi:hypothetical protein
MDSQNQLINKGQQVGFSKAAVLSSPTQADAPEAPSSKQYAIMPSMMYLIVQAMQDGANAWLEQMQQTLGYEQEISMTMIGGSQKSDGSWEVDQDRSFIANIVKSEVDMGEQDKEASMSDSWGHVGNAIMNGGSLGYVGGKGLYDNYKIGKIDDQIKDTQGFKDKLNAESAPGLGAGASTLDTNAQQAADQKLAEWKEGEKPGTDLFTEKQFDKDAAGLLKASPADKDLINKKIQEKLDRLELEKNTIAKDGGNRVYMTQMATGAATSGNQAYWDTQKGYSQERKGKDQAAATAMQSVQQTANSLKDKVDQDAGKLQQNAEQQYMKMGDISLARA